MDELTSTPSRWSRGASIIGREHARVGRNNQDGLAVLDDVIVVTDGCSSQPQSEVGARLGARFLASWLARETELSADTPRRATEALTAWLEETSRSVGGPPEVVLEQCFLFTFLAAARRGERALVFGVGDGVFCVDEAVVCLEAGPDNAPPYCAYRVGRTSGGSEAQLHFLGEARAVALGTDGLEALAREAPDVLRGLASDVALSRNPFSLQRRLTVLAEAHRFADDATLAVLGRA
jgi:hypothetical protein